MKITVESDSGRIYSYEGAKAAFLTVDMGDGYKQLVDGAVSPEFVSAVATSVERFTRDCIRRMMKEMFPKERLKELMDMIENGADDEEEDAEEDG